MQGAAQSECCGTVSSEGSDEGRKRCREAVMNFREKKNKNLKPSRDVTSTTRTDPTPVEVKLEVIQGLGFGNNSTALGI